jgi:hypothetical protein
MKGLIAKSFTAACLGGALAAAGGCYTYHDLVDPCYPQRYNMASAQEVRSAFEPQEANGHVLDQTVWNYCFDPGTDRLNGLGMEHLAYIARRRPAPDPRVFLQTAQDVPYDPANPSAFVEARNSLDSRRRQAVEKYLIAQTASRPMTFEVGIHDPGDVALGAIPANMAIVPPTGEYAGSKGNLPLTAGAGASNTSGGGGAPGGAR